MAKGTLNPMFSEAHGALGNIVIRRRRKGGISFIRRADMSNVKWSPAQEANRQRFRAAVAHAREALANPELRAAYEERAARSGKRAIEVAISDFLQRQKK